MEYRALAAREIGEELLRDFCRRQQVNRVQVRREGGWALEERPFVDDWDEEARASVLCSMRWCVEHGGAVLGALDGRRLVGFTTVEAERFGRRGQYQQMGLMHVSREYRRRGIGKRLFQMACEWARERGGEKLYISAHSAEETQGFYRGLGCVDAEEINRALAEAEPWDCQLEYIL